MYTCQYGIENNEGSNEPSSLQVFYSNVRHFNLILYTNTKCYVEAITGYSAYTVVDHSSRGAHEY
ncbi:hypothetical protein PHYBLDRAFT_139657 [Phycomyces blakesleeanus NRRL 1555(-)]|uniref:Uncharacterized protein n=1 Tax=Phycomyces blakesleeanus (strain ATCC 8743b / DSM 1359 / FGSC 10004 / NBRC 33097 / NRRL 1555) TaxID=763407 RepID=A0A162Q3A5_PHYB8|nr:hypothetical protein PHYBLDRAFT_139657 [Phycomyces blakesleeanus NRRL 1555(-)]OAD79626.1 hypothetical protein PHYBLDRAFT_139657 [Phycomyces blakesleeanus NRRL 1555(-)]|eukprot:XP_018297666.1 hypothetical protein PHYBLDRAFT_139657 [Phycomyces blakesleeanus NRRL 1555(-)]